MYLENFLSSVCNFIEDWTNRAKIYFTHLIFVRVGKMVIWEARRREEILQRRKEKND